ncbi:unnamed protein product [Symbiodinium sp. CCMP2592]|nr:unnamed protein product [Symbiodinium sp. CCMP2592]
MIRRLRPLRSTPPVSPRQPREWPESAESEGSGVMMDALSDDDEADVLRSPNEDSEELSEPAGASDAGTVRGDGQPSSLAGLERRITQLEHGLESLRRAVVEMQATLRDIRQQMNPDLL